MIVLFLNLFGIFNPIRAGGGSYMTPPLVFFYPHFSCVRARVLKFYDFLNNIKTNLVKLFFCQKVNFCGHREPAKNGQKKACQLFRAINQKKKNFSTFFPFKLQEYCLNIFNKAENKLKNVHRIRYTCHQDPGIRLYSKL